MSLIFFPVLEIHQVAVLRADYMTGQVLSPAFKKPIGKFPEQYYTTFESLKLAEEYIAEQSTKQPHVEFCIFDKHEKLVLKKDAISLSNKSYLKKQNQSDNNFCVKFLSWLFPK